MRAYERIGEILGDRADEESRAWVRRNYTIRVRVAGVAAFAFFMMIMGMSGTPWFVVSTLVLLPLTIVAVFFGVFMRGSVNKGLTRLIDQDCDPLLCGRRTLALLEKDKKNADPRNGLFSYAYALRWQGKWNEAAKLVRDLEDDPDPQSAFLYHNLMAYCAWDKRDLKGLTAEVKALKELSCEGLSKDASAHIAEHVALREMLAKEINGKASKAAAEYSEVADGPQALPAHRVLFSLKAADCLADPAERHARLAYAAENGGTTWCAAEAKKRLEKESRKKLAGAPAEGAPLSS
ncbi:hypothetical protein [Gordonibacter massiliensis (ex Traore et al. 2017)]|uniref:hypothetical protein n=1 Tax=Gordonibacter massiliensis (ex Traore et al. 2017) TaxID=1841863 RepID=UPI001C8B75A9|nr:hypothetical protein [Gordonibacter massiliensis (ex Traore et al. 2017)]MBX9034886.1 hypothetical protein [Gordonibacter massiliensis (ex Traore et al. 2017)]